MLRLRLRLRPRSPAPAARTAARVRWISQRGGGGGGGKLLAGEGVAEMGVRLTNNETGRCSLWRLQNVLVDTGADHSGIPEGALPAIERAVGKLKKIRRNVLTGAGLAPATIVENVELCVGIGPLADHPQKSCCAQTSLLVVPDLQSNLLLGRDLMIPCKSKIDFATSTFCCKGKCTKLVT